MLDKATTLQDYHLKARDGAIGSVQDFYFTDDFWTVRYIVAGTGSWLTGRSVLLSPYAVDAVSREHGEISVSLTRSQIEGSPSLDADKPVSRQYEQSYYGYYGWPSYWGGPYMWGTYPSIARDPGFWSAGGVDKPGDPHLRSMRAVRGSHVQATDGAIGHVEDFIIDDETWAIRYLVVGTRDWLPGKQVLIAPHWIERVSWEESTVYLDQTREEIQHSPEYSEALLTREYEGRLHGHYARPGYWTLDPAEAPVHG